MSLVAEHWPRQCVSTTLYGKKIIRVIKVYKPGDRHAALQTVFLSRLPKHSALDLNFLCCYLPAHELYCCWKHSNDFVCLCKWPLVLTVIFILSLFEMGSKQQGLDPGALMQ